MKREELLDIVKDKIAHIMDLAENEINEENYLEGDLGMDSLDFVEVEMAIEKSLGVNIPDNLLVEPLSEYTVGKVTDEIYEFLQSREHK